MASFDDRFFPIVDVTDTDRYEYTEYRNKDFVFDRESNEVLYVYKDSNDIWRKVDSRGITGSNWNSDSMRSSYLMKYVNDIEKSEKAETENEQLSVDESFYCRRQVKSRIVSSCNGKKNKKKTRNINIDDENESEDMLLPNVDDDDDAEILNELQYYTKRKTNRKRR